MAGDREDDIIEYKVRPVIRWVVTRFHSTGRSAGSEGRGEFDHFQTARDVGYALCSQEHRTLGWDPGDDRIRYPKDNSPEECLAAAERDRAEAAVAWERFKNSPEYTASAGA